MALKATIFKCELMISDLNRHYYDTHNLTIARHPSETNERMMLRILMFAIYANERLDMTKGLSTDEEPDLWQKSLSGEIEHWIELGLPDERRLRKAAGRAQKVTLLAYGGNAPDVWWNQNKDKLSRIGNLHIYRIEERHTEPLAGIAQRTMRIQVTFEGEQIWLTSDEQSMEITLEQYQ